MSKEKQIDIITDLLIDFDEMGFAPTTIVPDPDAYAREWRDKLTDALQGYRKQIEGKNIGTVHPVDEFVCSECGITLEGWTRVVTDEDDGELYYYEYEFRYCPNCGAHMRKEDEGK